MGGGAGHPGHPPPLDLPLELAQIWRQYTETIHDHYHDPKTKTSVVRNNGLYGGVVWGAYFLIVFRTDLAHIFFTQGLRFGPDFAVQPSPVLLYKVSPHKCQQKLGFSLFSDVQKCLEHNYFPPNIGVKIRWTRRYIKLKRSQDWGA